MNFMKMDNMNPKEIVPVYIKDFLGDYTNVSPVTMGELFLNFDEKYRDDTQCEGCRIAFDDINIDLVVEEIDFSKSVDELLSEIKFEGAMKTLPTNRIIKLYFTLHDEKTDIEYRTSGIRVKVDADTNFTDLVKDLIAQVHPDPLKLMKIRIRGGVGALVCDDHVPDWVLVFQDDSDDSVKDEL